MNPKAKINIFAFRTCVIGSFIAPMWLADSYRDQLPAALRVWIVLTWGMVVMIGNMLIDVLEKDNHED